MEQILYLIGTLAAVDLVVIAAGAAPHLLGAKIGYRWRKLLWLVLAVRLLIPVHLVIDKFYEENSAYFVQIELPVSYAPENIRDRTDDNASALADNTKTAGTDIQINSETVNAETENTGNVTQMPDPGQAAKDHGTHTETGEDLLTTILKTLYDNRWLLLALWILTAFALTDYHIIGFLRIQELLSVQSHECGDLQLCDRLEKLCREYRLRAVPQVLVCKGISSPMLFGYRRTRLLMPDRAYTEEELDLILRHELQHRKSGDLWYKLLIMLVCDLYWFNPVLRIMRELAYQDVECVCDAQVICRLSADQRKAYGNIILSHMAKSSAGDIVYGTSIFTGKRAVKLRIRNMVVKKNKWGYAILGVLIVCAAAGSSVWGISGQESNAERITEADIGMETGMEAIQSGHVPVTFRVEDLNAVHMDGAFDLTDYYIANKVTVSNRYYIDENGILWGYGKNDYGQLGISDVNVEDFYNEPVKIAENVLTVDCSVNGYFCVYLTKDGSLYGLGSNLSGLLGAEQDGEISYYAPVTEPALLMQNVAYARAGMESIAALDRDGNVWWWGQFCGNYHTRECDNRDYDSVVENDKNPAKMLYIHPRKILENCIYATAGHTMGAAIGADGSLYTWGRNLFGECGTAVTEDDFVREPQKVLDNVRMVWVEKIAFGSLEQEIPDIGRYDTTYHFNLFAQLGDGTMLGVGKGLGDQEKEIAVTGDLAEMSAERYSDTFVPIALEEYSEPALRQRLGGLMWGMNVLEVREFLTDNGLQYFETFDEGYRNIVENYIVVENCRYYCYFDERGRLYRILLQEGGSRDGKFEIGMSMEEVRTYFDGGLTVQERNENGICRAEGVLDGTCYEFEFADNILSAVYERAPLNEIGDFF